MEFHTFWRAGAAALGSLALSLATLAPEASAAKYGCGCPPVASCGCPSACGVDGAMLGDELDPNAQQPLLAFDEQSAAFASSLVALSDTVGGYIDPAAIQSNFRFRFEAAFDMNAPDRAEFFYPSQVGLLLGQDETRVDYQAYWLYYEHAFTNNFSVSIDLPLLSVNPEVNDNASGVGDIIVGFKYGLIDCTDQLLTFQLKNYIPTGSGPRYLGTSHYSIEPGFLYWRRLSSRLHLEAELRDWIGIGGTKINGENYYGNVLRYGVGLGYNVYDDCCYRVTPVVEVVGWSVLSGQVFDADLGAGVSAVGDTIVNIKAGARVARYCGGDVYAGYGFSVTGDRWYRDMFRLEYRYAF